MKKFLWVQLAVTILGFAAISALNTMQNAQSYAIGAAVVLFNAALLGILWDRLLKKKLVALGLLIIVFKYAILAAIIYWILGIPWVSIAWFSVGISSLMVSAVTFVLLPADDGED